MFIEISRNTLLGPSAGRIQPETGSLLHRNSENELLLLSHSIRPITFRIKIGL
jgi:hypothetical protein